MIAAMLLLNQQFGRVRMGAIDADRFLAGTMKRLALIVFITIACHASDVAAERSKLVALENSWNLAQLYKDAKALSALTAEGFVYTDTDGTVMNKAAFLADAKDPAYHATFASNEDVDVRLHESTAIVIGRYHTKGTYKGKLFDHHGRFTDTWVKQGDKWQCVASHTSLLSK